MPTLDASVFDPVEQPEMVLGLVAAVGTPMSIVYEAMSASLGKHGYGTTEIRLSKYLAEVPMDAPRVGAEVGEYERLKVLMTRGTRLRQQDGSPILVWMAAADIYDKRPDDQPRAIKNTAFVLRQLKHHDEVVWLRKIYGSAFHLLGVYCPEEVRKAYLRDDKGIPEDQVHELIDRDWREEVEYGQEVEETFHRADVFINLSGMSGDDDEQLRQQLNRYWDLVFGTEIITPTRDEYGMFLAYAASLRSADLSRQVGAAILDMAGNVISVGCNEVPQGGGGQYWGDGQDARDFKRGYDANSLKKNDILEEILPHIRANWKGLSESERKTALGEMQQRLQKTRLMALTEFGRSAHAEMEAILAAGRTGRSVKDCTLYTTTFPCHNCAKHIIGAGIARVIYIQPYPKSLAEELHDDAITFSDTQNDGKIMFKPFTGIAPRMYPLVFSMLTPADERLRRKDEDGRVHKKPFGLRRRPAFLTHVERENAVAHHVKNIDRYLDEQVKEGSP